MTSGRDLTPERYKFLKIRKAELERRLSEKYNQLKIVMNALSEDPAMLGVIKDVPVTVFGVKPIEVSYQKPLANSQNHLAKNEPEFYNKIGQDELSLGSNRKQSLNSNTSGDNIGHLERHNSLKSSSTQNPSMSMPSLVKHTQTRPNRHYPHPQHASQMTNQHHVKLKKSHSMIDKKLLALQNNPTNGAFYDLKYRNTTEQFYRDYCLMQSDLQLQQQQHYQPAEQPQFYQHYPQPTFDLPHHQPMGMPDTLAGVGHTGLGGYWAVSADNKDEKVWQPVPQGLSLDRKAIYRQNLAINEIRRQSPHQPTKSTSLSNFDVFNLKTDESDDTISISAEMKKREKVWCETALDSSGDNQGSRKPPHQGHIMAVPAKNIYYHKQQQLHNQQQEQQQRYVAQKAVRHGSEVQRLSPPTHINLKASYGTLAIGTSPASPKYANLHDSHGNLHTISVQQQTADARRNSPIQYHSPLPPSAAPTHRNSDIQTESPVPLQPVNVTVVEQGKIIMPYKEISKPFLMSDFYKYSTKYRQASNSKPESRNTEGSPFDEDVHNNNPQSNLLSIN